MLRRFLVVVLIAAAAVTAAVYLTHRGPRAAESGAVPALLLAAPADSPYVAYLDLTALRSSSLLGRLAAMSKPATMDRDYAEFVRVTGFDYTRDLDRLVLAAKPAGTRPLTIALAEGRFDREKISAFALLSSKVERHGALDVYLFPTANGTHTSALAFLSGERVALADGPGGAEALSTLANHSASAGLDPAMRQHIERVADAAFFAVGKVENLPENFAPGGVRSDQFTNLVHSLRWLTLAARPEGESMRIALEGECDNMENARQLAGTLDGLRLLGRAALSNAKARQSIEAHQASTLDSLLQAIEISQPGLAGEKRVRLSLEVSPQMIQSLTAFASQRANTLSAKPPTR